MLKFLAHYTDLYGPLRVFDSITFRAVVGVAFTFFLALCFGGVFIRRLLRLQALEDVSKPDSATLEKLHAWKRGTPTMGGLLVLAAMVAGIVISCDPTNPFVLLGLGVLLSFGFLGFLDDRIKLRRQGRQGLTKRQKLLVQIVLAAVAAVGIWQCAESGAFKLTDVEKQEAAGGESYRLQKVSGGAESLLIPFTKWAKVRPSLGAAYYVFFVLVIVAGANAVNLTDGLDGLASGCTIMVALTYAVLAYVVGNAALSWFFRIPFVPGSGELAVYCAVMVGAVMGFLWFNAHPAQVFLGDTGSLALGASIAYVALVIKHELVLVIAGGIFVLEAASVLLQMVSFRAAGRRILKCAPFHHHLEFCGWHENKVVVRLWMVGVILAAMAVATLKMH